MWGKESRQSRGYDYRWEKQRKLVIERDKGLCQICLKAGRITPGRDVDHIVSKARAKQLGWNRDRTDALSNLALACVPCHKTKTEEEQGKKKNPPKRKIGSDGWPIE